MKDAAAFRKADIEAVHGYRLVCFHTAKDQTQGEPTDLHHVLGRSVGRDRSTASSVLNCAILRRDIHAGPIRDAQDQARVYLRIAEAKVMNAMGLGHYELRDEDYCFMDHCREMGIYEHGFPPRAE